MKVCLSVITDERSNVSCSGCGYPDRGGNHGGFGRGSGGSGEGSSFSWRNKANMLTVQEDWAHSLTLLEVF
jgi:hypothetical protein